MISLTSNQIERIEKLLGNISDKVPKVIYRAINRAAASAKTEFGRKVREKYYVTQKAVLDTIDVKQAYLTDPTAEVKSSGHNIPLYSFRVTPKDPQPLRKKPVVVRVKRGGGGEVRSAFVAKMKSGHFGVFERAGKRRLPIGELYGPPVPIMMGNPSVIEWVETKAIGVLGNRLDHEITRALEGHG